MYKTVAINLRPVFDNISRVFTKLIFKALGLLNDRHNNKINKMILINYVPNLSDTLLYVQK